MHYEIKKFNRQASRWTRGFVKADLIEKALDSLNKGMDRFKTVEDFILALDPDTFQEACSLEKGRLGAWNEGDFALRKFRILSQYNNPQASLWAFSKDEMTLLLRISIIDAIRKQDDETEWIDSALDATGRFLEKWLVKA